MADKQLPAIEVLQLPDVLRYGAGGDIQLGRRQNKAAQPGAGLESLERIEWRKLAGHSETQRLRD